MTLPIHPPAFPLCRPPARKAKLLKRLSISALALVGCAASVIHADATLSYELMSSDGRKTVKQLSISRFFVRIDEPGEAGRYLLFQAGKFFPLYAVDEAHSTYRRLTPAVTPRLGPASRSAPAATVESQKTGNGADRENKDTRPRSVQAQADAGDSAEISSETPTPEAAAPEDSSLPETVSAGSDARPGQDVAGSGVPESEPTGSEPSEPPSARSGRRAGPPVLKPTKKTRHVAGIRCRVVRELLDGEPVIEHCMANSARLGLTDREVITLSRLFAMSRSMQFGWLGVGSADEEFVAVQSRDLRDKRVLQLTSVSTQPLPAGHLRIPRTFKLVESDAPGESGRTGKAAD